MGLLAGGAVWLVTALVAALLRRAASRGAGATVLVGAAVWTLRFALLQAGTRSV